MDIDSGQTEHHKSSEKHHDGKVEPVKQQDNSMDSFQRILEPLSAQEEVKIVLTDSKYCFIKYPKSISEKDVLILKKWIELLELTLK